MDARAEIPHEVGMTLAPSCGICKKLTLPDGLLFENALWQVRAIDPPTAVPGWVLLVSRRHLAGPAEFDEREAASFGPTLRHLQRVLLEVTGALRIYLAAMGESSPHLHAHFVPRYPAMPKDAKAWGVFDLQRAAAAGEIPVDEAEAARVAAKYRDALTVAPPRRRAESLPEKEPRASRTSRTTNAHVRPAAAALHGGMIDGRLKRALRCLAAGASCLLLGAPALADPTPAAVKPPVFGERGELVVTSAFGFGLGYFSQHGGSGSFEFDVAPSAHYFVMREFSLGLGVLLRKTPVNVLLVGEGFAGSTFEQETTWGATANAGYNVPLGELASLWIRGEVEFAHNELPTIIGPGGIRDDSSYAALSLELFAPFLVHPAPHCFIGFGPDVWGDVINKLGRRFDAGASSTVGAWF